MMKATEESDAEIASLKSEITNLNETFSSIEDANKVLTMQAKRLTKSMVW